MYLGVSGVKIAEHATGLQHSQHTKRPLETHFVCRDHINMYMTK